jgi:chromate transporter
MKKLLQLFFTFARIGVMTFGGGYAMLPIIQREVVEKKKWATEEEVMDYYAIGQCTPGVIAVNTATFVGCRKAKVPGGILATLGVIAPSLIIITVIAAVLSNFAEIPAVRNAFAGIRVAVCVLIINSVVKLLKKSVVDKLTGIVFIVVALCAIVFRNISPVVFVLAAGVLGIVTRVFVQKRKEGQQ